MDAFIFPLGVAITVLVLLRLGVLGVGSIQQLGHQRLHQQLSLELMRERIAAAQRTRELSALSWNGYRKFVISERADEADGVCSFVLTPHDRKPLQPFKPGQYITFRVNIPGREKPVVRCYSLSSCFNHQSYRIGIKRVASPPDSPSAPPGLVSNYFHEQLSVGDILDLQAPSGRFFLDLEKERPAVLIGGGIGVTPLLSMAHSVANSDSRREVLIFYGVRDRDTHAYKAELEDLAEKHPNIRLVVSYSQPAAKDELGEGRDYHHTGHITIELLRSYLRSTNYEVYICGPPSMMESLVDPLRKWGAATKDIHTEAFGPATVSKSVEKAVSTMPNTESGQPAAARQVNFAKSNKSCVWKGGGETLLDLASDNGVSIDSGCRAGNCGTCGVAVKSGQVRYLSELGMDPDEGSTCLTCVALPDSDVVLDA